jgi:hypothetical protein
MSEVLTPCAVAGDTKVETPEGALTVKSLAGKAVSVFTREADRVRFRMMRDVRLVAEAQSVLRVVLENGASFRVGPGQVLFRKGMSQARADQLQPGDELVPVFHYGEGYQFVDDKSGETVVSAASLRVARIEPGGTADLYSFSVNVTGTFFLTAGVLCQAAA